MARSRRRRLPVELSDEAHAGLDALATRHHVSKTALIEALGLIGQTKRPIVWDEVLDLGRSIDRERLSRRPVSGPGPGTGEAV